jgi:hypothetical protein
MGPPPAPLYLAPSDEEFEREMERFEDQIRSNHRTEKRRRYDEDSPEESQRMTEIDPPHTALIRDFRLAIDNSIEALGKETARISAINDVLRSAPKIAETWSRIPDNAKTMLQEKAKTDAVERAPLIDEFACTLCWELPKEAPYICARCSNIVCVSCKERSQHVGYSDCPSCKAVYPDWYVCAKISRIIAKFVEWGVFVPNRNEQNALDAELGSAIEIE